MSISVCGKRQRSDMRGVTVKANTARSLDRLPLPCADGWIPDASSPMHRHCVHPTPPTAHPTPPALHHHPVPTCRLRCQGVASALVRPRHHTAGLASGETQTGRPGVLRRWAVIGAGARRCMDYMVPWVIQ